MTIHQQACTGPGFLDVDVWAIPLRQPSDAVAELRALLDPAERRRAAADPGYAVAHGAARRILGARLGCPPGELRRTFGPCGKPRLAGAGARLGWNLSASGDWALLAVLPDPGDGRGEAVGVDIQHVVHPGAALRLARRYFPGPEAEAVRTSAAAGPAYTRLWTCKEAYVKAYGGRLVEGLQVVVPAGESGIMSGQLGRCRVAATPAPAAGYLAAVAVTGPLPPRPQLRRWEP